MLIDKAIGCEEWSKGTN